MASHHRSDGNILPFGQPTDAPGPRFVRPIPVEQIARAMGEPVDLYVALNRDEYSPTFREEIEGLISDIRADVQFAALMVGGGMALGMMLTVVLAYCWSMLL